SLVTVRTPTQNNARPTAGTVNAVAGSAGDGGGVTDGNLLGTQQARSGMFALEPVDLFNLLCIPPPDWDNDSLPATWGRAAAYCQPGRAMLIVDPPAAWTANPSTAVATAETGIGTIRTAVGNNPARNAAVYFPRLRAPDPQQENRLEDFAPCG